MKPMTLNDPDVETGKDIVIYDGQCRICAGQMQLLARLDVTKQLTFLSLHDRRTPERYPDLSHAELMRQMYVINRRGARQGGALAARYLSRRLPLLWPLAPLLHLPGTRPFWQWLYRRIAERRYHFGKVQCADGACQLPE